MRARPDTGHRAHDAACAWIAVNMESAATAIHGARAAFGASWKPHQGRVTAGVVSKYLGAAMHCVQDSFSPSHVRRGHGTAESPGRIREIFSYIDQKDAKAWHEEQDDRWHTRNGSDFSLLGRQAINACKTLIRLTVRYSRESPAGVAHKNDFKAFLRHWCAM